MEEREINGNTYYIREANEANMANMAGGILQRSDLGDLNKTEASNLAQNILYKLPLTVGSFFHTQHEDLQAQRDERGLRVNEKEVLSWVDAVNNNQIHPWDCPAEKTTIN